MKTALDRASGNSQRFGNVIIGEIFDVSQDNDRPIIGLELLQGFGEVSFGLGPVDTCIGSPLRVGQLSDRTVAIWNSVEGFMPPVRAPSVVEALVLALVDRDAKQPCGELRIAAKVPNGSKCTEEDVLSDFFRERTLSELTETDGVDAVLVAGDEVTEC